MSEMTNLFAQHMFCYCFPVEQLNVHSKMDFLYIVFLPYNEVNDILDGKINNPNTLYNTRMRNCRMFYLFKAGRSWSLQLRMKQKQGCNDVSR